MRSGTLGTKDHNTHLRNSSQPPSPKTIFLSSMIAEKLKNIIDENKISSNIPSKNTFKVRFLTWRNCEGGMHQVLTA